MKTRMILSGFVGIMGAAATWAEGGRAERVFRYEETLPVVGMPEIRGARPAGETLYKPVMFQADKGGWTVVADSIPAYKKARDAALANHRPALLETAGGEGADEQPSADNPGVEPAANVPNFPIASAAPRPRPAASATPASCCARRAGDDAAIRIRCGDYGRAEAAILRLRAEGQPITQANMNRELGYAATPSCSSCCGSGNSCGRASGSPSSSPAPANRQASASHASPRPANRPSIAQPVSSAIQGNSPVVTAPLRSFQTPTPMPVQQAGGGRRFSTHGRSR